ncbi:cysteine hydrolase family protein [Poseidonocella sp. HB161398]|uniref:cysteine hydrolase family protein n=1 Tax=Poseidonocella sp. HB161398 TaxID=2320855 RepID=UPI00110987C3|nr:cysteine hydrolase [Poseidonocella sp. HB161398]
MSDWLLVVDMQPGFGHPDSPWCTPGYDAVAERTGRLVAAYGEQVLFTRFLPPAAPQGAWQPYYDRWPFAVDPARAALWDLDPRWAGRSSISSPRFAKWREAAPHLPGDATLAICGVATDCCVLGTAVEAVDDGRHVRLIADACAAGTPALHEAALTVMRDRAPMLVLTDTAAELALRAG